jgi:hypothetical protein
MALSSMLPSLLSASPLLAQVALPSAMYGSKVLARHMSSYLSAPEPERPEHDEDGLTSTSWECTFGPLAKHLVETRKYNRVMPHEATFVSPALQSGVTLLGMHLRPADRFDNMHNRRHNALSDLVERLSTDSHRSMSSVAAADVVGEAQPGVLTAWANKVHPRMKGGVRKLVLRQINRKIVARLARRFTIGIPVLGFYFVSKLLKKDCERVASEYKKGELMVSGLFATAVLADVLDLAAQATIIAGFAHSNFNVGLATAAALLLSADKASLACAALSFSSGVGGELLSLKKAAQLEEGIKSE